MKHNNKKFVAALKKLPPPISCFSDGAACPWCGDLQKTVTFGENVCALCSKPFCFGYPDWHPGDDPLSHVPFPWREFDAVGQNPDALPNWKPNALLKDLYYDIRVREAGGEDKLRSAEAEKRRAQFYIVTKEGGHGQS